MTFKFSLESLLRYTINLEEKTAEQCRQLKQLMRNEQEKKAQLIQQKEALNTWFCEQSVLSISELTHCELTRTELKQAINKIQLTQTQLESELKQKEQQWHVHRQKRKQYEELEARERRQYLLQEEKRNQQQLDEYATLHYASMGKEQTDESNETI